MTLVSFFSSCLSYALLPGSIHSVSYPDLVLIPVINFGFYHLFPDASITASFSSSFVAVVVVVFLMPVSSCFPVKLQEVFKQF